MAPSGVGAGISLERAAAAEQRHAGLPVLRITRRGTL